MQGSRPPTLRLSVRHRRILYAIVGLVWSSGTLWLAFHYFLRMPGDFGGRPHALEIWWLRLHGLVVLAMLVALGSVLPVHVRLGWQLGRNRGSGLSMKIVLLWLAATGYALYYFADDDTQAWLAAMHWAVGLPLPLLLGFHIRHGQRRGAAAPQT